MSLWPGLLTNSLNKTESKQVPKTPICIKYLALSVIKYYEILHSLIIGKAKILFGLHDGTDQIWLASNEHDVQTSDWGTSAGVITGDDLGE